MINFNRKTILKYITKHYQNNILKLFQFQNQIYSPFINEARKLTLTI